MRVEPTWVSQAHTHMQTDTQRPLSRPQSEFPGWLQSHRPQRDIDSPPSGPSTQCSILHPMMILRPARGMCMPAKLDSVPYSVYLTRLAPGALDFPLAVQCLSSACSALPCLPSGGPQVPAPGTTQCYAPHTVRNHTRHHLQQMPLHFRSVTPDPLRLPLDHPSTSLLLLTPWTFKSPVRACCCRLQTTAGTDSLETVAPLLSPAPLRDHPTGFVRLRPLRCYS